MLKLSQFHHNHLPSGVKKLAKFIRRGFPVVSEFPNNKKSTSAQIESSLDVGLNSISNHSIFSSRIKSE